LRLAGLGLAATGVLLVGASAWFAIRAGNAADDVVRMCGTSCEWNDTLQGRQEDGRSAARWAWVSSGAGVAALAGGALLYYLGHRAGGSEASMTLGPGRASMTWAWRY